METAVVDKKWFDVTNEIHEFVLNHFKAHGTGKGPKVAAGLHEKLKAAVAPVVAKPAEDVATERPSSDKPHTGAVKEEPKKP